MAIDPLITELYRAFMDGKPRKVLQLCSKPEDPLRKLMNKRKDTVLHLALNYMRVDLVLELLKDEFWPPSQRRMLIHRNSSGNTILHEAATHDDCIKAAKMILKLEPDLINIRNEKGEPPIFRAVRYGQIKMFKFLDQQVQHVPQTPAQRLIFYKNKDGATILHVATYNEHFELAHYIAKKHKYLVGEKNEYKMTDLQILATKPSAFKNPKGGWLKHLIRTRPLDAVEDEDGSLNEHEGESILISIEDEDGFLDKEKVAPSCRVLWWDRIHKECRRYEAAGKLAKLLVEKDTAWIESDNDKPKPNSSSPLYEQSPLILATKWGCLEIVDQILTQHPQTVEQVDRQYGSILHLAIKHRQIHVFDKVLKMNIPLRRMVRKADRKGNSILHMVGRKKTADDDQSTKKKGRNGTPPSDSDSDEEEEKMTEDDYQSTKKKGRYTSNTSDLQEKKGRYTRNPSDLQAIDETRSPAFELQDDLILFERVEKILKKDFHKDVNFKGRTPEQLFALNKEKLRQKAEEWLKRAAGNYSIVAVLIATVAFAAAYTVPGGSKDDGTPVLINQPFFVGFTICNVLSLTSTLTAIVIFLWILISPFRLQDFKESLPQKLMLGITCLIFSLSMMMLAFTATIILMINNKERWTKIALYTVAFFPVTTLAMTYLHLFMELRRTFKYTLKKIRSIFPESGCTLKTHV